MAGDDDDSNESMTHIVWALQHRRKGRATFIVPIKIGYGRIDPDGHPHLFLECEPKGGYGSYIPEIKFLPRGVKPGTKTEPERPGEPGDEGVGGAEISED